MNQGLQPDVLNIRGLNVVFDTEEGELHAVHDVNLDLPRNKIVALVGESGSGKSVTSKAIMRLIHKPGRIQAGSILFHPRDGESVDIAALSAKDPRLNQIRGKQIAMIFQEPMSALSPVHTIGNQLREVLMIHRKITRSEANRRVIDMLGKVGIPSPQQRIEQYPFELSGGMRQRVVIAMAMLNNPQLLIADEPTTALDVTIQAQILELIRKLQRQEGASVLFITHDLAVVAKIADFVAVMYLGRIVETGSVKDIIRSPCHPYTRGLLESLPALHLKHAKLPFIPGSVPALNELPPGCPFHPRCKYYKHGVCDRDEAPPLTSIGPHRQVACFRVQDIQQEMVTP
ncbi:MAG: ABC transporter ATP-binding protein [Lentisphaerae bacterium]|nr:MAG: ABC transporter ATP-binding protein [Lentisphaerota bacterium]